MIYFLRLFFFIPIIIQDQNERKIITKKNTRRKSSIMASCTSNFGCNFLSQLTACQKKILFICGPATFFLIVVALSTFCCGEISWFNGLSKPSCWFCGVGSCWWFAVGLLMLNIMGYASWLVYDTVPVGSCQVRAKIMGLRFYWVTLAVSSLWVLDFFLAKNLSVSFVLQLVVLIMSSLTTYFFWEVNCQAGMIMFIVTFWSSVQAYCQYELFCLNIKTSWWRPFGRAIRETIKRLVRGHD